MSFFVTPHAIRQFQNRVANVSATEVIDAVLSELDKRKRVVENGGNDTIYAGLYRRMPFYAIIVEGTGEWPAVATILGESSKLHGQFCKRKARIIIEND